MKVIHVHFGTDGGAERFFTTLARGLHERGVEQRFFIRPDRPWRADIAPLGPIEEGVFRRFSISRFFLQARIERALREFRPDVFMTWGMRASRTTPAKCEALRVARMGDYPQRLVYFRNSDVCVGNTPGVTARFKELGWTKRLETVSNFTSIAPLPAVRRADLQTPDDAFVVFSAGRFVPRKGFHTLMEAVARQPNAWLWLAGDGEERQNLEKLADSLGIRSRMRFLGWRKDVAALLAGANVFVMPSSHEPLGNVILEAWSIGAPVISTASEGPIWMMTDGRDGLLVPIGDAAAMGAAIGRLREEPGLGARLSVGGRATLDERFSMRAITDAYLRLFESGDKRTF